MRRLLTETIDQIARDDGTFTRAKVVFTESDERCGLTAELDGGKRGGGPLRIGAGVGLAAVLAARAGCQVIATDLVPEAVACVKANAVLNGVADRLDARLGDCYEPGRRVGVGPVAS